MPHRHEGHHGRGGHRRRDPRIARTRAIVLEAARKLLVEEGSDAVTALRISEATGIARTTIYRHWPDREDLLRDTLAVDESDSHVALTGDTRTDLVAMLEHMVERIGKRRGARMMVISIERSGQRGEAGGPHRKAVRRRMDPLRRIIEAGVESGQLRAGLDIDSALAQLAGPPFFQTVLMGRTVTGEFIKTVVDSFLTAHAA